MDNESFTWNKRTRISVDIAKGINFLHNIGIIHRDLKSRNILMTDNMEVKITDFGIISTKIKNDTNNEENQSVYQPYIEGYGTVAWMAPELFDMDAEYTPKASPKRS